MAYSSQPLPDCINPNDLTHFTTYNPATEDDLEFIDTSYSTNLNVWPTDFNHFPGSHQDSAVDLRLYGTPGYPQVKAEDSLDMDTFINTQYSTPASHPSNTPSPHNEMIFSSANSTANSPGGYIRDHSQTSSPEASTGAKSTEIWEFRNSDSIMIPQQIETPKVTIQVDKTKTRAETQIKTVLILDPLPSHSQYIRFPRRTLSKSKQLASTDEIENNEEGGSSVRLDLTLVCATAVEQKAGLDRALRRARGEEAMPRRARGTQVSEIDKEDDAHPQNGGAVVICEGCKERERKRYDRKKKRNQEEENEWTNYEDDRIIMINEKEFKRWQDVEQDHLHGSSAKRVEFAMRITCYCRHQEEKSPVGYKVIFTFRDVNDTVLAQQVSEIIQITDDHKNRELPTVDPITTDLRIHNPGQQDTVSTQYAVPMYTGNYTPTTYGLYSQPTTPVMPPFQGPLSPMDGQYPQSANPILSSQMSHPSAFAFNHQPLAPSASVSSFANHQRYQSYSTTPMLSPTEQFSTQAGYPLHRPHSMDSFTNTFANLYSQPNQYPQNFASQPPSRNVSRPASPSWDQGASRSKKMRGFYLEDPDNQ